MTVQRVVDQRETTQREILKDAKPRNQKKNIFGRVTITFDTFWNFQAQLWGQRGICLFMSSQLEIKCRS